ncbi:sirohydrochlorin chelatase [Streptomyces sp. NPDC059009]|uniref:sirohydrochlorin chelatase n=1 Tax=Streptomyces sp. NPDC059009 TaxID=3346694 RepID=UPI0036D01D9C
MVSDLVLAVHGSALPAASATISRLCDAVELRLGIRPLVGHLDHQSPSLSEALDSAGPGAVVVPLLLGDGYHRTIDIPAVVEGRGCVLTESLSGAPAVAAALHGRLRETENAYGDRADAVVLAAAGSSRAGGNDGAQIAARQLRARLPVHGAPVEVPVVVAYCSAAEPTVPDAVARLRAAGYRRIAIATHLLAPGRFTVALARAGADLVAEPLADHPRIAELVADIVGRAGVRAAPVGAAA